MVLKALKMIKYTPKLTPKQHQATAVKKMMTGISLNFDDQGLGKTKQGYDYAAELIRTGKVDIAVFVVKSSLKDTIVREIRTDANQLTVSVIGGSKADRARQYSFIASNVLVVSYDTVVADFEWIQNLFDQNKCLICFDESHYIKNHKALRTKCCLSLAEKAKFRLLFSGTPIPNKREDIFTQLKAAGIQAGANIHDFKDRFSEDAQLRDFLAGKFIRRKKEQVSSLNIPPKRHQVVEVELAGVQRKIYDKIKDDLVDELRELGIRKRFLPIENVLTRLLRLIQASSNPNLLFEDYSETPAKFATLKALVQDLVDKGEKVIVWTGFRKNIEHLSDLFRGYGVIELHGGISNKNKLLNSRLFNLDSRYNILIATPQCAREGFTLTAASTAIYLDRGFSLLDWAQSQDRIHRISQTNVCDIVKLIGADTIDERIDGLLESKSDLQRYLLGDTDELPTKTRISIVDLLKLLEGKSKRKVRK